MRGCLFAPQTCRRKEDIATMQAWSDLQSKKKIRHMGNHQNSSTEVLEYCANKLDPQIGLVWHCVLFSITLHHCTSFICLHILYQNGWETKPECIIYDDEASDRFIAADNKNWSELGVLTFASKTMNCQHFVILGLKLVAWTCLTWMLTEPFLAEIWQMKKTCVLYYLNVSAFPQSKYYLTLDTGNLENYITNAISF